MVRPLSPRQWERAVRLRCRPTNRTCGGGHRGAVELTRAFSASVLKIYAAVDLDTILRERPEAGRAGCYDSLRTS